jgi:hypothetical protein
MNGGRNRNRNKSKDKEHGRVGARLIDSSLTCPGTGDGDGSTDKKKPRREESDVALVSAEGVKRCRIAWLYRVKRQNGPIAHVGRKYANKSGDGGNKSGSTKHKQSKKASTSICTAMAQKTHVSRASASTDPSPAQQIDLGPGPRFRDLIYPQTCQAWKVYAVSVWSSLGAAVPRRHLIDTDAPTVPSILSSLLN